jgi:hypothetical protein
MLLKVSDALAATQTLISKAQEAITDRSGTIVATGVSQALIASNALRSGFFFQNNSLSPMWLNDLGTALAGAGSIQVAPGAILSMHYPVTGNAWQILGTAGTFFTAREF